MAGDEEMVKAGVEGAVGGLFAPFADILNKLLGPGAEELGLTIKDQVHFYRRKRYQRLMERSKLMFANLHKEPQPMEPKLSLPILEHGSLEANDDLQDRWAALLVNSSGKNKLLPGAPDILKQLAPFEVLLLQICWEFVHIGYRGPTTPDESKPLNKLLDEPLQKWFVHLVEKHKFKNRPGMQHHYDIA